MGKGEELWLEGWVGREDGEVMEWGVGRFRMDGEGIDWRMERER